jgi:hypothetical protein
MLPMCSLAHPTAVTTADNMMILYNNIPHVVQPTDHGEGEVSPFQVVIPGPAAGRNPESRECRD